MGVRVEAHDAQGLTLAVPFEPNVNHVGAVFGGSLAAAATLAGWGFIWLALKEHNCPAHILIQESTIAYLKPVTKDFLARCHVPGPKSVHSLMAMIERKGKGRIKLGCDILQNGETCVHFTGSYAALRTMNHLAP
jgi:thioesterase domain-containing protein